MSSRIAHPRRCLTAGWATAALVFVIVLAVLARGVASFVLLALVLALALRIGNGELRLGRQLHLWLSGIVLIVASAFAIGERDTQLVGLALSTEGLQEGVVMAVRAVTVAGAVSAYANSVSVSDLARLFERAGLSGLGFALGVAFNTLPTLRVETRNAFDTMRLRGGFRRHPLSHLNILTVTIIANVLRHADDIVSAAEARAFEASMVDEENLD